MADERYKSLAPTFEQVAIPKGPGTASEQESVRLFSSLPDAFSKVAAVGKQLFEEGVVASAREKAARDPSQTIKDYKSASLPHIGQRAGYELAVKISAANLEVEAMKRIQETLQTAEEEKWEQAQLNEEFSAIQEGFIDPINDLDPEVAANLRIKLKKQADVASLKFSEIIFRRQAAESEARGIELVNQINENVVEAAKTFDTDADADEYIFTTIRDLEETLETLGIDPRVIAKSKENVQRSFDAARSEETAAQGYSHVETTAREVEVEARTFDNAADADAYLEKTLKALEESLQSLGNKPHMIHQSLSAISQRFHTARIRGEFRSAVESGQGHEYFKTFDEDSKSQTGSARGLEDQYLRMLSREMAGELKASAAASSNQIKKDLKEVKSILGDGMLPENFDSIIDEALKSGDSELISEARNLLRLQYIEKTFATFSAREIQVAYDAFSESFRESNGGISSEEIDQLNLLDKLKNRNTVKAGENLAEHALSMGVDIEPIELSITTENGVAVFDMSKLVVDVQNRAETMRNHAREHGAALSIFTDDERRRLGVYLDDADNDAVSRASLLVSIFQAIEGDDALHAIQEIKTEDPKSLSGVAQMVFLHAKGGSLEVKELVELAFRGADLKNQGIKGHSDLREIDTLQDIFYGIIGSNGGQTAVDPASAGAAYAVALNIYRAQTDDEPDTFKEIVQKVFGLNHQLRGNTVEEQGGLVEIDDVTLWIPPNMTAKETREWYQVNRSLGGDLYQTDTDLFAKLWRRTYGLEEEHPFPGIFYNTEQQDPVELNDNFWKTTSLRQMEGMPGVFYLVGHDGWELYDKTSHTSLGGYGRVIIDLNQWPAILKEEGLRFDP